MSAYALPFTIEVDSDLAQSIPEYLRHRFIDVGLLRHAAAIEDWVTVQRLARDIADSGAIHGFLGITEIGESIDQAAECADERAVACAIDELEAYLNNVSWREIPSE
ncbi:MAG: hypothetical protein HY876_05590 [Coriobacteriales bacterium]|nr:hypothetical protein [Coriobacteriales bacterium]